MAATISRGVRAPIIREGDDIVKITVDSVLKAAKKDGFYIQDKDVIAVTEAVVARAAGNYATTADIAKDVKNKFSDDTIGVVFPIFSRNRFAICLKGIAMGCKKVVVQMGFPTDEVGNHLISEDALYESGINPYNDVLTSSEFIKVFGNPIHEFTGVDYIKYYTEVIQQAGAKATIILGNRPEAILQYTNCVICADTHTRQRTQNRIIKAGGKTVLTLADILNKPVERDDKSFSGYNNQYGLLGSNKATESTVKLFPNNAKKIAEEIHKQIFDITGKNVEAMVYGDGAFKDPVGKIWELADPVVSPGYTDGLKGLPNELKLKYLADNDFANLEGEALTDAIRNAISKKEKNLKGNMASQGTTPRQITDLIGSLCDLTSGSGDKGTPIVVVQNYFKNFSEK